VPAVAVLVLAGGLAAPDATSASPRPHRAKTAHIQVASYNTASHIRTRRAVGDVVRLAETGADVLGLQEMASPDRRARVARRLVACGDCRFRAFVPRGAVPGSMPILYRAHRFHLLGSGSRQITDATRVGSRGAGPAVLRARYVNWVHLRERRTGRSLFVLNTHAVPTVQGESGGPNTRQPRRLAIYRKHMRGVQEMIRRFERRGARVFLTGDLNVNYRTDCRRAAHLFPYHRLGEVGMRASYRALGMPERGTHVLPNGSDRRLIDYVYYLPHRSARPEEQHVLHGYSSDHRPLLVGVTLAARR
jgi:endonuclease/exonuclease/phosphatase family metal-dependent hydrolase